MKGLFCCTSYESLLVGGNMRETSESNRQRGREGEEGREHIPVIKAGSHDGKREEGGDLM